MPKKRFFSCSVGGLGEVVLGREVRWTAVWRSFFFLRHTRMRNNSPQSKSVRTEARSHRPKQVGQSGVAPSTPRGTPLPPCGSAQPERCVSRLFLGHFLNGAEGLCAPPSSRLECDNHETTPLCCDEFGIYGFLSGRLHQRQHSGEEHRNKSTRF